MGPKDRMSNLSKGFRHFLPLAGEGRVLCYVWASREPAGSVYPNPYRADVMTIVLRSGAAAAGRWQNEVRDLAADYVGAFGQRPERVTGVAVVVDTDDTGATAVAWFDDLVLELRPRS